VEGGGESGGWWGGLRRWWGGEAVGWLRNDGRGSSGRLIGLGVGMREREMNEYRPGWNRFEFEHEIGGFRACWVRDLCGWFGGMSQIVMCV